MHLLTEFLNGELNLINQKPINTNFVIEFLKLLEINTQAPQIP